MLVGRPVACLRPDDPLARQDSVSVDDLLGAPLIVTFSNRCLATEAIACWCLLDETGQLCLIAQHFDIRHFTATWFVATLSGTFVNFFINKYWTFRHLN